MRPGNRPRGFPAVLRNQRYTAIGRTLWDLWSPWGIEPLHKDETAYLLAVGKAICSAPLEIGDMYSSSATMDPLFWLMHTTVDRLTTFKRAKRAHLISQPLNEFWPASSCYGHSAEDSLIFDVKDVVGSPSALTNADLLKVTNIRSEDFSMNYVFDHFSWAHCNYTKYPQFRGVYESLDSESLMGAASENEIPKSFSLPMLA